MTHDRGGTHRGFRSALLAAGLTILASCRLSAQAPAPAAPTPVPASAGAAPAAPAAKDASSAPPAFEVVSIKPSKSDSMVMRAMFTSDGISVSGMPMHMLLREAFNISDSQLIGEPGWVSNDRFDIEAKVAAEDVPKLKAVKPTDRWAMLLPILEDRFALKFHHESKDLTQYVLVVAKGGLKMKEATPGDTYSNGLKTESGTAGGAGMMRVEPGELIGQGVQLQGLVRFLSFQFHSPVTDQTGLTGKYDMDLKWTPDETEAGAMRPPDGGQSGAGNPAPVTNAGPSIFTALEEQLGLKLEAHKEPGDAIVIDHIEQPSPN
jgi:bla regulator protein blaR1